MAKFDPSLDCVRIACHGYSNFRNIGYPARSWQDIPLALFLDVPLPLHLALRSPFKPDGGPHGCRRLGLPKLCKPKGYLTSGSDWEEVWYLL